MYNICTYYTSTSTVTYYIDIYLHICLCICIRMHMLHNTYRMLHTAYYYKLQIADCILQIHYSHCICIYTMLCIDAYAYYKLQDTYYMLHITDYTVDSTYQRLHTTDYILQITYYRLHTTDYRLHITKTYKQKKHKIHRSQHVQVPRYTM